MVEVHSVEVRGEVCWVHSVEVGDEVWLECILWWRGMKCGWSAFYGGGGGGVLRVILLRWGLI